MNTKQVPAYLAYQFKDNDASVNAFDEMPLWSAAFGLLLLNHLEIKAGSIVIDIGSGTGFPLFELAGRCGNTTKLYGIDPWKNACLRAEEKLKQYGYTNVGILNQSADKLPFSNDSIDLIVSNLGINNFANRKEVFNECNRVLKPGGKLALTTNLNGHWNTFYQIFKDSLIELNLTRYLPALKEEEEHRGNIQSIGGLFTNAGFKIQSYQEDLFKMKFVNGTAFLNHHFVKLGWLGSWLSLIDKQDQTLVFTILEENLNKSVALQEGFQLQVPMLYMEGVKTESY